MANSPQIDQDFLEFIIAYNCTIEETFTAILVGSLKLEYIKNESVKRYIGIIFDFYIKRGTLPGATEIQAYLATDDLKRAYREVVTRFKTLDSSYNQEELLENTEQYIKERAVLAAVKNTVDEVHNTKNLDTNQIYQRFDEACGVSLVEDLGFEYFNEIDRHIADLTTEEKYISTGYEWLDKMLGGGFLETGRALYMFSGATNSGKSILLGNLAANILEQGRTVVVITLEMPEMIYAKRISSKVTNIPLGELKRESQMLKDSVEDYKKKNPNAKLIIKEFPPNSVTSNHIKAYLKKLVQQKKIHIDAVVLDYLTLLAPMLASGSSYADGKDTAEQIRALSYPLNIGCPFISACQANRGAYDVKDPGIEHTGESIGIPQTVDFQASIWSDDAEKELGVINIGLQKSRFGPNYGTCQFRIDYDTLSITEQEDAFADSNELASIESTLDKLGSS